MDKAPYHSVQLDKPRTFSSKQKVKCKNGCLMIVLNLNKNFRIKQLWDLIQRFRINTQKRYLANETFLNLHPKLRWRIYVLKFSVNVHQTSGKFFVNIVKNLFWQTGRNILSSESPVNSVTVVPHEAV